MVYPVWQKRGIMTTIVTHTSGTFTYSWVTSNQCKRKRIEMSLENMVIRNESYTLGIFVLLFKCRVKICACTFHFFQTIPDLSWSAGECRPILLWSYSAQSYIVEAGVEKKII